MAKKERDKLEIALDRYRALAAAQKELQALRAEEEKAKAEEAKRVLRKQKAQQQVEEANDYIESVRAYAEIKVDSAATKRKIAAEGFFKILSYCNEKQHDFIHACNVVGNTQWLVDTVLNPEIGEVTPDGTCFVLHLDKLRNIVLAEQNKIESLIADTKKELDDQWEKVLDKKSAKPSSEKKEVKEEENPSDASQS